MFFRGLLESHSAGHAVLARRLLRNEVGSSLRDHIGEAGLMLTCSDTVPCSSRTMRVKGHTPLYHAAGRLTVRPSTALSLLEKGASADAANTNGETLVRSAARS
ncbi:hypothetical protein PG993_003321 [Apiospora rasikravindrae]|uniref:Ankyrin repeat protein n=1 Tax=Apiospora rasikravindrae TaxID=990691 RepID=A0ABR1U1D6_9PEZI